MKLKYFKCKKCGNIVAVVEDSGMPLVCCGENMTELIPGTTDGAAEKHVPVCEKNGNIVTVTVGSVDHPMEDKHYIQWISLETKQGTQMKALKPGEAPKACFALCEGDEVVAVYEYCNIHSLWTCKELSCKAK